MSPSAPAGHGRGVARGPAGHKASRGGLTRTAPCASAAFSYRAVRVGQSGWLGAAVVTLRSEGFVCQTR